MARLVGRGGPFAAYLDARQARRNAAVPDSLRTLAAQRLVRRANAAMAVTAVAALALCLLLGIGVRSPWPYLLGGALVAAGVVAGSLEVRRLGALEGPR